MIEVDFRNKGPLIGELVTSVVGDYPSCWNVVLPPSFGEELFAEALGRALRASPSRPRVAIQGADITNPSIGDFIRDVHWKWSEERDPPKRLHASANVALDMLLDWSRHSERPLVLVLKRFHKVLDCLDKWVLGKLSTEEESRRLRTITISPLPYSDLKKRWESHNHYFTTSDYGRTHARKNVEPLPASDLVSACQALCPRIPDSVISFVAKLTGGYPEPMSKLLEWWLSHARPQLRPDIRGELLNYASNLLVNFVEWLDPLEEGVYRDHVIDIYHGVDIDNARDAFRNHPWRDVVLDEDGLRAEALGAAALRIAIGPASAVQTQRSRWYEMSERSVQLYERQQYESAFRVLEMPERGRLKPHDELLKYHSQIMRLIAGGDGDDHLGEDTNYRRLKDALQHASDLLQKGSLGISQAEQQKIQGRYRQLYEIADAIDATSAVDGPFKGRIVDILAGFAGEAHRNPRAAVLLLLVKAAIGAAIAGDASACQFALALPEQVFRVWALWKLSVDYYKAPSDLAHIWELLEKRWPSTHGDLVRAVPNMPIPSFFIFAHFAIAKWQRLPSEEQMSAPETTFNDLMASLSAYSAVRTGKSHGLFRTSKRERDNYFALIERWLTALLAACPNGTNRDELLEVVEPLPLVDVNGFVRW